MKAIVARSLKKIVRGYRAYYYLNWKRHWSEEITYWDKYLRTKGLEWTTGFVQRCNPSSEFQSYLADFVDAPVGSEVRILDVGSGPLTTVGKAWPGRSLHITAVDPLAKEYDRLLECYKITPPVRTIYGRAEDLLSMFPPDHFDLVNADNSIDHCYDPVVAIQQMIGVVKPSCVVYLIHAVKEGAYRHYQGLHQWDFFIAEDNFMVGDGYETCNLTNMFQVTADIECRCETVPGRERDCIVAVIRKKALRA